MFHSYLLLTTGTGTDILELWSYIELFFGILLCLIVVISLALCTILALNRVLYKNQLHLTVVVRVEIINTMVIVCMIAFGATYRKIAYIDVAIFYPFLSFISTLFIVKYFEGEISKMIFTFT
ncbi:MAG: monovalent cation/H+ antiporter complex subunit F [Euryarchaeota archaeon]|nr:monovalent cation/H+ antiporter complex subunit F [Euryarchaeota archaeon]